MRVFLFQNCGKLWSVSLGHSIKHKHLLSEKCILEYKFVTRQLKNKFYFSKLFFFSWKYSKLLFFDNIYIIIITIKVEFLVSSISTLGNISTSTASVNSLFNGIFKASNALFWLANKSFGQKWSETCFEFCEGTSMCKIFLHLSTMENFEQCVLA